jgi:hypothetical protein
LWNNGEPIFPTGLYRLDYSRFAFPSRYQIEDFGSLVMSLEEAADSIAKDPMVASGIEQQGRAGPGTDLPRTHLPMRSARLTVCVNRTGACQTNKPIKST